MNKLKCCVAGLLLLVSSSSWSQRLPTATEPIHISGFAGGSGVYTGLNGGRNAAFTAGADLTLRRYWLFNPSIELRGTYPVIDGHVDSQRNFLGGLRFERSIRGVHPYFNILAGRGQIDYSPRLPDAQKIFVYAQSTSFVISPGAGFELDVSRSFALRTDLQVQRYDTPITASGHLYAKPITLGVVYRLNPSGRKR